MALYQLPKSSFQNVPSHWELEAGNWKLSFRVAQTLYVRDIEFKIRFTLEFVLLEGKGEVDAGAILIQELGAFGGPPGDGAKSPPLLAERHLQMPLFERARSIDDFNA